MICIPTQERGNEDEMLLFFHGEFMNNV